MANVAFHGSEQEALELIQTLARNCSCAHDGDGALVDLCGPHRALVTDQRFLDGVLTYRHLAARLLTEEGIEKV